MRITLLFLSLFFVSSGFAQAYEGGYSVYSVVILPNQTFEAFEYRQEHLSGLPVVSLFGSGVVGAALGGALGGLLATQLTDKKDGFGDLATFLSGALVGIPVGSTVGVMWRGSNSSGGGRILPTFGGAVLGSAASLLAGPGIPVALIVLPPLGATFGYTLSAR